MCNTREENAAELAQEEREEIPDDQVYQCPECNELEDFTIEAIMNTTCYVNGEAEVLDDSGGDIEWDGDDHMTCGTCGYEATVDHFELDDEGKHTPPAPSKPSPETLLAEALEALKGLVGEIDLSKLNIRKDFSLINAHAHASKFITKVEGR